MIGAAAVAAKVNCPPASGGAVFCDTGRLLPTRKVQADRLGTAWLDGMR